MPKLFIANCTKQHQILHYRVRENAKVLTTEIPIGGNALVYQDALRDELQFIVDQLSVFGLKHVNDAVKNPGFVGLCYNFDSPVEPANMYEIVENNEEALEKQSQEIRENSIVAINQGIEKNLLENGVPANLNKLEVEIQETPKPDGEDDGEKLLKQKVQVSKKINQARVEG